MTGAGYAGALLPRFVVRLRASRKGLGPPVRVGGPRRLRTRKPKGENALLSRHRASEPRHLASRRRIHRGARACRRFILTGRSRQKNPGFLRLFTEVGGCGPEFLASRTGRGGRRPPVHGVQGRSLRRTMESGGAGWIGRLVITGASRRALIIVTGVPTEAAGARLRHSRSP